LPIDTTTGLPRARARTTSRQIVSEATYEPPGLFTRSRMARARSSAAAARSAPATVSAPMPADIGPRPLRPDLIGPEACTSATNGSRGLGSLRSRLVSACERWYRASGCRVTPWPARRRSHRYASSR
jgi:hypothetical protein